MEEHKWTAVDSFLAILFCILFAILVSSIKVKGQEICGFDYLEQRVDGTAVDLSFNNSRMDDSTLLVMPIVFHIIHNASDTIGQNTNITDQQLISAVDNWNFRMPINIGGDPKIRLCIAEVDPDGNLTTGITRSTSTAAYEADGISIAGGAGEPDINIKTNLIWDKDNYYNIYIVSEINGNDGGFGIQGYAYFPTASPVDGTVLLYNVVGNDPDGSLGYNLKPTHDFGTTFIHELGHALGLYHPHQGGSCAPEADCWTEGDFICDTPPITVWNSCNPHPCTGVQVTNYMGYQDQDCRNNFTAQSGLKMRYVFLNSPHRNVLLESDVCDFEEYVVDPPEELCSEPCPNDDCPDAIEVGCDPVSFCNVNCTNDTLNVMTHPVVSSTHCGGTIQYIGQWFKFTVTEEGLYTIDLQGTFTSALGASGNYGPFEGSGISLHTGICDSLVDIFSHQCPQATDCFCPGSPFPTGAGAWAGGCDEAPCSDPVYLQPYWWENFDPPMFPIGNWEPYDPTQQNWTFTVPLVPGTYYINVDAFTPGDGQGGFYPSFGEGTISVCPEGPLPIELLEFEAVINEFKDDLYWITATETNNDYFTLEISNDGFNWNKVTTVLGQGNSSTPVEYHVANNDILTGDYYYRLTQTDFNGKTNYYPAHPVNRSKYDNQPREYYDLSGRFVTTNYSELQSPGMYLVKTGHTWKKISKN